MCILPFLIKNALPMTLKTRMPAATHIVPRVALKNTVKLTSQKNLLGFYLRVVYCPLKKFEND